MVNRWLFNPFVLSSSNFCLALHPDFVWANAISNFSVGLAYLTIAALLLLLLKRSNAAISRSKFWLLSIFVFCCGVMHWLDVLTLWVPIFEVRVLAIALTAIVLVTTAIMLWLLLPQVLALPSPALQKAVNEASRRTAMFLSSAGGVAGVGGWEVDLATHDVSWSEETYRLHGVPSDFRPTIECGLAFYAPEGRAAIRQALNRAIAGGSGWDLQLPFIKADGRRIWVRSVGSVEMAAGRPARLAGALQDITAFHELAATVERQAEVHAETTARELAILLNSPDALFIVRCEDAAGDPVFVFEAISPAFETMTGLPAASLVGRRSDDCLPPLVVDIWVDQFRRCQKLAKTVEYEVTYTLPVGTRDYEVSIAPVKPPEHGQIVQLVGSMRDVTERNLMQLALQHSQKMEAIGRLSAGVAHDFNNILQGIVGSLELVLDEIDETYESHAFINVAINSAMRGSSLTHHLLSYARKQMLRPQAIDLSPFFTEIQMLLARTLGPKIIVCVAANDSAVVLADPGQLQTALLNLAINASHAMPKGGMLHLEAREEAGVDQSWIVIAVRDTGIGMDEATLAQSTEPFFTTKGLDGSGLGLSMVQGFAVQSGGTFAITSRQGKGTTIELRLPVAAQFEFPDRLKLTIAADVPIRVLLVDDSLNSLPTVASILERSGFTVSRAERGEQALELLKKGLHFDAIVTDVAMPGLSGIHLISEAQRIQPALKAVLITDFAKSEIDASLADGTVALAKPFHRTGLIDALVKLIDRQPDMDCNNITFRDWQGDHPSPEPERQMAMSRPIRLPNCF